MNHLYLAAATAQHTPAAESVGLRLAGVVLLAVIARSMFTTFRDRRRTPAAAAPPAEEERYDERYAA